MSVDTKTLVKRLRALHILDEVGSNNPLGRDAADTIERLERDRDELRERCERLRGELRGYAIGNTWMPDDVKLAHPIKSYCRECDREWTAGRPECHAEGCLAAPKDVPNESRCTHKSSKIMWGIDNTYDVAWCDDCGEITWASDGCLTDEELHRSDREKWCESRVLAWGCAREANGANACKWWCGHPETCAVTLRTKEKTK